MPARINLIGMKFGRLTVDSLDAENGKWRCVCDCGKVVWMRIHLGWTPEMAVSTKTLGGKS